VEGESGTVLGCAAWGRGRRPLTGGLGTVPKNFELHRKILDEAHWSKYSIHPGTNKMYQAFRKCF
jgi:hypothetical protein